MNDQSSIEDCEGKCLDFMAGIMTAMSQDLLGHLHQVSSEYKKEMEKKLNKQMIVIKGKGAIEARIDEMLDECEKNAAVFTLNVVNLFSNILQ